MLGAEALTTASRASSKSPSTAVTFAPSARIRSTFSGFASAATNTCTSRPLVRPA